MPIALLSNVTVTSLAMRVNTLTKEEVYCPHGYDTWLQEISNPDSSLYASGADVAFAVLYGRSLLGDMASDEHTAIDALEKMASILKNASERHIGMTFVASTLDIPDTAIRPLCSASARARAAAYWRQVLEDISLPVLDLSEMVSNIGRRNFYNERVWYMGAMPFSKTGEEAIASEIETIWRALRTARKKCLALDLDNTLWGGVIGELGLDGIHLDKTGSGSRFYDFQKKILELKRSGVLLAVISKNNMVDALSGIDGHPDMVLRSCDFAAIMANWKPKSQNLESLARSLNIGTDSFVFIDDNPMERDTMRMALPEVAVPNFPEDSSKLESFMLDVAHRYFLQIKATSEDANKTEQYAAEAARREVRTEFQNRDDYLRSLEMKLVVERVSEKNALRASQLTRKTNQFNLTTRRYTDGEMCAIAASDEYRAYIGELADRYGDYGKIILAIMRVSEDTADVEAFLMSCRAMEREVETAFIRVVENELLKTGVRHITARYAPTEKNYPAASFLKRAGYRKISDAADGTALYAADIPFNAARPDMVKVEVR
ncbi:MAG: HAD-IIIC family phosphatase [Synergistaceae bacterium]|jgi:FkbH-like protein|nr:HAD-IIIC family phosphatase [Synergistaceae bacterium]